MGDDAPPISNYKGVMLCDRPSGDGGAYGRSGREGGPTAFVSRVTPHEPIGWNPVKKENPHLEEPKKKTSGSVDALTRHKKWLRELREYKRRLAVEEELMQNEAEEKRKKFTEYQKQMRDLIRKGKSIVKGKEPELDPEELVRQAQEQLGMGSLAADVVADVLAEAPTVPARKAEKKGKKEKKERPAWALTEGELARQEEDEADDLINFATGLDFDRYMEDMEVRQKIKQIRQRVKELAEERKAEHLAAAAAAAAADDASGGEGASGSSGGEGGASEGEAPAYARPTHTSASRVRTAAATAPPPPATAGEGTRCGGGAGGGGGSEAGRGGAQAAAGKLAERKEAERILQSSHKLRSVHSPASIKSIMEEIKEKKAKQPSQPAIPEEPNVLVLPERDKSPPKYVRVEKKEGAAAGRAAAARDGSNLPFLHRHPGV
eukprot:tig00000808_g4424.t1